VNDSKHHSALPPNLNGDTPSPDRGEPRLPDPELPTLRIDRVKSKNKPHLSEIGRAMFGDDSRPAPHRTWTAPIPAELSTLLPDYEVMSFVGRSGMGAVYKARQKALGQLVAIKILSMDLEESDPGFAERFRNEARAMARLSHLKIVDVHKFGETPDGLLYIVMQFVEGTDLAEILHSHKNGLPIETAVSYTAHVCQALAYAPERGIIHRDIKPANVMVTQDGSIKLADCGLAKLQLNNGVMDSG
jgi:serine/threonine protein kinase